jgi:type VI protein secretion system component VasF
MSDESNERIVTDPSLDPILAYLREHSGRYSPEALRQQLIQNGYDADRVNRAIQIHQGENRPGSRMPVWLMAVLILIGLVVLLVGACFAVLLFSSW